MASRPTQPAVHLSLPNALRITLDGLMGRVNYQLRASPSFDGKLLGPPRVLRGLIRLPNILTAEGVAHAKALPRGGMDFSLHMPLPDRLRLDSLKLQCDAFGKAKASPGFVIRALLSSALLADPSLADSPYTPEGLPVELPPLADELNPAKVSLKHAKEKLAEVMRRLREGES